jgi:capsular polysaccharide export protein
MAQGDSPAPTRAPAFVAGPECSAVSFGMEVAGSPLGLAAQGALFPDFALKRPARRGEALAAWAGSPAARHGAARARARGLSFVLLGCGLLRAPPRGERTPPVLSATALALRGPRSPADILDPERVLAARGWEEAGLIARAAAARRRLVAERLGGLWWAGDEGLPAREDAALVVAGEAGADDPPLPQRVEAMLDAALAENGAGKVVMLMPSGRDRRSLRPVADKAAACGAVVLTRPVDPWAAIERAARVYVAGGETGLLALLAGREVRCFAPAFYSGWGITGDAAALPQKPFRRTLDEIFAGACLIATRHLDPYRGTAAAFEDILDILALWRGLETANRAIAVCVGMSFWKRRRVADFFRSTAGAPPFRRTVRGALAAARRRPGGAVAVWASRVPDGLAEAVRRHDIALIRVEDGFVRSVGLGSDFLPAASLVLDRRGMYFDPTSESDLEVLLRETAFEARLIERARRLIALLVARGVTKYNLPAGTIPLAAPPGRRRLFVPGQVADDLSVRLGGGGIGGNLDLLRRVRADNPDAFILYKPHPDVEAGHRAGAVPDALARQFADIVIRGVSTASVLDGIDELHTLTSLAGFEALLRRRKVVVYGRPFYAGWGLTSDRAAPPRGRLLSLEELVAGVLILYPRYLDPATRLPCGPELVVERLETPELWRGGAFVALRRFEGALRRRWRAPAPRLPAS